MSTEREDEAWAETPTGDRYTIRGNCSFGRSAENNIVLKSPNVSRCHAVIHIQDVGEFWLIDFGSSNGTFLNHRRIQEPVRLSDHDQIMIGDSAFIFRQPSQISEQRKTLLIQQTLKQLADVRCWLLVADIRNFALLSSSMPSDSLAILVGGWISKCKEIVEERGGAVNKYLGDGFLAYWAEWGTRPNQIVAVISALKELQAENAPDFRFVVHLGSVAIGGLSTMGEESLMGQEVNFIFRLEKLASSLGVLCGLSDTAQAKLAELFPARSLGQFELKGFSGKRSFFAG